MVLLCASNVQAEKWYFEPTVDLRLGYDDNVRFRTSSEESAFSTYLKADARFGYRTEVSDVKFGVVLDNRRYQGQSDLNTNDQLIRMDAAFKAELNLFRLDADYDRDSTRTSELLTTGFLTKTIRRNSLSLRPSWQRYLNERTSLELGYHYTDTRYGDAGNSGLVDYRYDVADLGLLYNLSERTDFHTALAASKYEAKERHSESRSYWFQVGMTHRFTETLSGTAMIGPRYTEFDLREKSSNDTGYVMDLSLKKAYETFSLEGKLSTGQSPSGSGRLLRTHSVRLKLRGKLSERMSYAINARFNRSDSTSGFDDRQDRDYAVFQPRISWRASRWWTLTGSYRYRWQDRTGSDSESADSNAIFITARYIWPRESLDRWMQL